MEQKSTKTKGIYSYRKKYLVDSQYKGERIRKRGFTSLREAEQYLIFEKQGIDRLNTEVFRPKITLEMAALRYLEEKAEKTSLETDIYLLKEMIKI